MNGKKFLMKIALIDNMNNNFFAIARYFHELKIEADLFLIPDRSNFHFDPRHDTWHNLNDCEWIKEFPITSNWKNYYLPIGTYLNKTFKKYDKLIACGASIGLLWRAGLKADIFIPYGSDLYNLPFAHKYDLGTDIKSVFHKFITTKRRAKSQKKGIISAKKIISNTNWKIAQDALLELKCNAINLPRIMVYKENIPHKIRSKYGWLKKKRFYSFFPNSPYLEN